MCRGIVRPARNLTKGSVAFFGRNRRSPRQRRHRLRTDSGRRYNGHVRPVRQININVLKDGTDKYHGHARLRSRTTCYGCRGRRARCTGRRKAFHYKVQRSVHLLRSGGPRCQWWSVSVQCTGLIGMYWSVFFCHFAVYAVASGVSRGKVVVVPRPTGASPSRASRSRRSSPLPRTRRARRAPGARKDRPARRPSTRRRRRPLTGPGVAQRRVTRHPLGGHTIVAVNTTFLVAFTFSHLVYDVPPA